MNQTIEQRIQSIEDQLKEIRKELEESLVRYKQSQYPFTNGNVRHIYSEYKIELRRKGDYYHKTEEQTKALIDFYIERVNYQNACEIENKVVKVEYEGYP